MLSAGEQGAASRAHWIATDSGKLLVLVAFMVVNGIALKMFPAERSCSFLSYFVVQPPSLICDNAASVFALQMLVLFNLFDVPLSEHQLDHWRYVTRLVMTLSEYCLQTTLCAVRNSPFFGMIIDLSTDRASRENMLVYIVYWDMNSMTTKVTYLCCVRLMTKTADSIFDAIKEICDVCDLNMQHKLRTFCADGDNTMQGLKQGLSG